MRFPPAFLWGCSTAAHQVEGDNRNNDWWAYEQAGALPHKSSQACRHFERYESDFDLAQSLGHNAHRLSIEWSRIEPEEGRFDPAALTHYANVIAALRARNLEPLVTLHHFTNPHWFAQRGGWEHRQSVALYSRYVDHVSEALGRHVRYWLTINEPTVYVLRSYIVGNWPPLRPNSWLKGSRVLRNLCRAHAEAYSIIHRHRGDAMVGFAHSAPFVVPRDAGRKMDRAVAKIRDYLLNDLPFRLLGREPRQCLDFIGINYYVRQAINWEPKGIGWVLGKERKDPQPAGESRRFSELGWEIHPEGLQAVLAKFAAYGVPLIITENGIATSNESLRVQFLEEHVRAMSRALQSGIDVRGYLYWTLFDNFEWTEGYTAKFGLAAVEPDSLARVPRPAAVTFERICRGNEIDLSDPSGGGKRGMLG